MVVLAVLLVAATSVVAPMAGAVPVALDMTTYSDLQIDPVSGRVFVSGGDAIRVFEHDGSAVTTIDGLERPGSMDVEGGSLYVVEQRSDEITRVSLDTLTVAESWAVGAVHSGIAVIGDVAWFVAGAELRSPLHSLELADGTITDRGGDFAGNKLVEVPGQPDQLLIDGQVVTDVSLASPAVTAGASLGNQFSDAAINGDGTRVMVASAWHRAFSEHSYPDLAPVGTSVSVTMLPNGIAHSPAGGGVWVATTASGNTIRVLVEGHSELALDVATHGAPLRGAVDVAPNGEHAYVVTRPYNETELVLEVVPIATELTSVLPTAPIAGVPSELVVDGVALGDLDDISVGGITASAVPESTTRLRVTLPTAVPAGPTVLAVAGRRGTSTWPLDVQASPGATIHGTVAGDGPIAGVEVRVSGPALGDEQTVVTDASGGYSLSGLPWGDDYRVAIHDPHGQWTDQLVHPVLATPTAPATLDVTLSPSAPLSDSDPRVGVVPIADEARDLVVHPASGRFFASVEDEVVVVDADGRLIARLLDQSWPQGLAVLGDDLLVNQRASASIARIDTTSLEVEAVVPVGAEPRHDLAIADGQAWLVDDDDVLHSFDPATDAMSVEGPTMRNATVREVSGSPHLLLEFDTSVRPTVSLVDARTDPPTRLVTSSRSEIQGRPVSASVPSNRLWSAGGGEHALSNLTARGTTYPARDGGVDHTPLRGGLLLFGPDLFMEGNTTPLLTLVDGGYLRSSAWSPSGDRVVYSTREHLVVERLSPSVTAVTPGTAVADVPAQITIDGHGFGGVTTVTVGGVPADVVASDTASLVIDLPRALGPGAQNIVITTPLGTAETEIQLIDNVGGTVSGTVMDASGPLAGVELTLRGEDLATPRVTTTGDDGSYAIAGLPWGERRSLSVAGPGGDHLSQEITGVATTPNLTTTVDVTLDPSDPSELGPGPRLDVALPDWARRLVVHPATGRAFVSVGDEVIVLAADGRRIGRVVGQPGADGLAVDGDTVFVARVGDDAVAAIDARTLQVDAPLPAGMTLEGDLVWAGERLWLNEGRYGDGRFASLDPTTGATHAPYDLGLTGLAPVAGAENLVLVWDRSSAGRILVVNVTPGLPVSNVVSRYTYKYLTPGELIADASAGVVWHTSGAAYDITTLDVSATTYPGGSAVAHTAGGGGLLAFGGNVTRIGDPTPIAIVDPAVHPVALAFGADSSHLFVATTDSSIVRWDLGPHVDTRTPSWIRPGEGRTVTLRGVNLGSVSEVRVGGVVVPHETLTADEATIEVPASVTSVEVGTVVDVDVVTDLGSTARATTLTIGHHPPDPPSDVVAAVDGRAIDVSWSPPIDPGSSEVSSYQVAVDGRSVSFEAPGTTARFEDVSSGTHQVMVSAVSADGTSDAATSNLVTMPVIRPDQPTEVVGTAGPGSVRLSWSPPASSGSAPISGYEIRWPFSGATAMLPADQLELTVHGLPAGVPQAFLIRSVTDHSTSYQVLVGGVTPLPAQPLFTDVDLGHPLYWEIWSAVDQGITTGYADGTFRPTRIVNRQTAVALLWRAAGSPTGRPAPAFADVAASNPFYDAIAWAVDEGITTGFDDGTFRPAAPVTRQSWLAFQHRSSGSPPGPFPDPGFTDVDPEHPFLLPISWAVDQRVASGYATGTFLPTQPVTRQSATAFLVRPTWPTWVPSSSHS